MTTKFSFFYLISFAEVAVFPYSSWSGHKSAVKKIQQEKVIVPLVLFRNRNKSKPQFNPWFFSNLTMKVFLCYHHILLQNVTVWKTNLLHENRNYIMMCGDVRLVLLLSLENYGIILCSSLYHPVYFVRIGCTSCFVFLFMLRLLILIFQGAPMLAHM